MSYKMFDVGCTTCAEMASELLDKDELPSPCPHCGGCRERVMSAPHQFSTIVPTYPGSQRQKAGYVHKFTNKSATRIQVGHGGGQSPK